VRARYIIYYGSDKLAGTDDRTHRSDLNLAIDNNRSFFDSVQAKDGCLWQVDDWSSHHGAENPAVADGVGTPSHVFDGEFSIPSLPYVSVCDGHLSVHPYLLAQVCD
jgi:hypothetical protein